MKKLKKITALSLALLTILSGLFPGRLLAEEVSRNKEESKISNKTQESSQSENKKSENAPIKEEVEKKVYSELRAFVYNLGKKFMIKDGKGAHYLTFNGGAQFGQGPYKLTAEVYIKNNQLLDKIESQTDFISEFQLPLADIPFGTSYLGIELEAEDSQHNKAKSRLIGTISQEGQETTFDVRMETKPVLYYVSFDLQGGEFADKDLKAREEVKPATIYTLPAAEKVKAPEGMSFVSWEVNGVSMAPGNEIIVTENYTVKAVWAKVPEPKKAQTKRLGGPSREDVAVAISKEFYDKADKVIVVQNLASADAMSASNISQGKYPILFTSKDNLFDVSKDEIKRLGAKEIILMGGLNTVTKKVQEQLAGLEGIEKVTRVDGADRYEVSVNSLKYMDWEKDKAPQSLIFASGLATADALAAAPYAKKENGALILVRKEGADESLKKALAEGGILHNKEIKKTVLIGGSNTVTEAGKNNLDGIFNKKSLRISGSDRYQLAVNVAKTFENIKGLMLANGLKWADALAVGPAAQKENFPIGLVKYTEYAVSLDQFIKDNKQLEKVYILGGKESVSEGLFNHLKELASGLRDKE